MNPVWLVRNVRAAWRSRGSARDFVRRLRWTYHARLPRALRMEAYCIEFSFRPPVGRVRLEVRGNGGADHFVFSEVFEHEYYGFELLRPPDTVLDLGANAGFTALYFARRFPRAALACVEPMPDNIEQLRRNLALNGVSASVFEAAIDTRDAVLRMQVQPMAFGHKVAECAPDGSHQLEVRSMSVPAILRRLGWSRIGLLKIDIEGHEQRLLADAPWLAVVDTLCIECHLDFGEPQLRALASRFGFDPPLQSNGLWILTRGQP